MTRTIIYSAAAAAAVFTFSAFVPAVPLSYRAAVAVRAVVLAIAGFSVVIESVLIGNIASLTFHDQTSRAADPLRWIASACFGFCIYIGLDMSDRIIHGESLSFRTPLAFFVLAAFVSGVYRFNANVIAPVAKRARDTGATVRIVATDTSKPGPDIELNNPPDQPPTPASGGTAAPP
jgi:hypothetical protein